VKTPGADGTPGPYVSESIGLSLFDLTSDPGESRNVAADHPDVVARLQTIAESARDDLGDAATHRRGKNVREPGRL
jgi:hypothetical protein